MAKFNPGTRPKAKQGNYRTRVTSTSADVARPKKKALGYTYGPRGKVNARIVPGSAPGSEMLEFVPKKKPGSIMGKPKLSTTKRKPPKYSGFQHQ